MNISYSNYRTWNADRDQWVIRYIVRYRQKQTRPMAVGTAFDAYVKAYLEDRPVSFRQIAEEFHPEMHKVGSQLLVQYIQMGAYQRLQELIADRPFSTSDKLLFGKSPSGVPLCGIPDLVTYNAILDWKVNGAPPGRKQSPAPGYGKLFEYKPIKRRARRKATRTGKDEWWEQIVFYRWMVNRMIGIIHQCTWSRTGMQCSEYVLEPTDEFARGLDLAVAKMYEQIENDHIYDELSVSESRERVAMIKEVDWAEIDE